MKKKLFLTAILTLLCCTLLVICASAGYNGTPSEPTQVNGVYQIGTAEELYGFAEIVNRGENTAACAVLTADITVNEKVLNADGTLSNGTFTQWTPIGYIAPTAYAGTFDGQGHTISGLYYSISNADVDDEIYAGLFGVIHGFGTVKNVDIADSYISVNIELSVQEVFYAGGVCGSNSGTITNCGNGGNLSVNVRANDDVDSYVGGVCGNNAVFTGMSGSTITNCYNTGTVHGDAYSGGVCGYNYDTIENCYNTGDVSGNTVGGVCGNNAVFTGMSGSTITNCYNTGTVHGDTYSGGVCGYNYNTITNCYNTGSVSDDTYSGGVCGCNDDTVTNCYWLNTAYSGDGIGIGGGTATKVKSKTADDFASGEVTWLLNHEQQNGPWRQDLGKDDYPVLDATRGEVICIYIDGNALYADPDNVTLPDPGPGKAYFDGDDNHVDPETYKFTDGEKIFSKDAAIVRFVYGNGTPDKYVITTKVGSVVMPDAPSKPGCIFMGWRSGSMTYLPGDEVGTYGDTTFTAVWANMSVITPTEPDEPDEGLPFTDVPEGAWYYDAVKQVYEAGLMNGVTDTLFDPDGTLTRAMFWTILARASGVDTDGGATWYAVAQQWAIDNGVSDGTDAMGALTREQLVTMLWRLNGEPVVEYLITAPDAAQISSWALEAMRWAASTGLIEGDETGALSPTAHTTRAQAATFIWRYLDIG